MRTLKTTSLSLKRIIENADKISSKFAGQEPKKLTPEQKNELIEMASKFESYGKAIQDEQAIMESAKGLSKLCELAKTYALTECEDVFQEHIVRRDMDELQKRVTEYGKVAQACYGHLQELKVIFDNIHHTFSRYYDSEQPSGKQPLQNEESNLF